AYDPSEAFKQLAGSPVFVFAYDTFGRVVNDFAYKSQVKADGSFQAAGLPNASHYGVCFGWRDKDFAFRAPLPEDGIQSAFAYNQTEFRPAADDVEEIELNTQIPNEKFRIFPFEPEANDDENAGCRVYLTSSRTVDIANHINIFPVVPNS